MKVFFSAVAAILAAGTALADTTPQTGSYSDPLGNVTLQAPQHSTVGTGAAAFDSTFSRGGASIAKFIAPPDGGGNGVSAQTLEETDGDSTKGIPANWSPSFVTGADSSEMSLTFYNVKPVNKVVAVFAQNAYSIPPHFQLAFVVRVFDVPSGAVDKSYIVFPFSGAVYLTPGDPTVTTATTSGFPAIWSQLLETFTGREMAWAIQDSSTNNNSTSSFFGAAKNGTYDDRPQCYQTDPSGHVNSGGAYSQGPNGACTMVENAHTSGYISTTGTSPMPRMYQSQDPNFKLSLNLGPIPSLKRIQVDSFGVMTRTDAGAFAGGIVNYTGEYTQMTANRAPYSTCCASSGNADGGARQILLLIPNKNKTYNTGYHSWRTDDVGANLMDWFYVFNPTSGQASSYTKPSSTTNITASSKMAASDAPDNPYQACPATVFTGGTATETDGITNCSTVNFNVPTDYVGVQHNFTMPSYQNDSTYSMSISCTLKAICASDMTGYSVTGAHWVVVKSGTHGVSHCPGCNVSINTITETAALTATCGGCSQVKSNMAITGAITGGTDPNASSACTYSGDLGTGTAPVSNTYSTTWNAGVTGFRRLRITCTEGLGSYSASIVETMSRTSTRWCTDVAWNKGPGTSVADPAPVYCPAGF